MDGKKLFGLFWATCKLSACTFGGGYVMIPLMRRRFVNELGWLEDNEMLDLTAIAQSAPGALAVNASILVGYRVAGTPGALCCAAGAVLPPLVIISLISLVYAAFRSNVYVDRAMRGVIAGVAAVVCDAALSMGAELLQKRGIWMLMPMVACFAAVRFLNVHILLVLFICAAAGALHARRAGQ